MNIPEYPDRPRSVPVTSGPLTRKKVTYMHHTRDKDGDVVFFFVESPGSDIMQSSPVLKFASLNSAVLDTSGHGALRKYLIVTQNTEYEVQMPKDKADHLLIEVG